MSFLIWNESFYRCLINSRVVSEYGNGFFLTVIGLADSRPLRPRIVLCTLIRQLRHHCQLNDGFAAVPNCRSHAVVSGITATDNDDILILCTDIITIRQVGINQTLCGCLQKFYCIINALGFSARCIDVSWIGRTASQYHCIILFLKFFRRNILTDIHTRPEYNTLLLHQSNPAVNDGLFQFHIRNAVHQQTANTVFPFIDGHGVSSPVQLQSGCQTGRARTDDGYFLSRPHLWDSRLHESAFISRFNDGIFVFFHGNRVAVQSAGASLFTKCRTYSGGKLRKAVGQQQPSGCIFHSSLINQFVPLRTEVVQRTAGHHAHDWLSVLTEWNTAIHAACTLFLPFFRIQWCMKFPIGLYAFERLLPRILHPFIFQKSRCFSHDTPLLLTLY